MSLHTAMASGASQGPNHLGTAVDHAQGSLHNADVAGGGEDTVLGGIPDEAAMPPPQAGASEALDPQGSVNAPSHGVPPPDTAADRPRLLWKGALVLHDGTQLPGAAIVTHMAPWAHLRGSTPEPRDTALEAEAELCFALEMLRHHPLRVRADVPASSSLVASGAIQLHLGSADDITMAYLERVFGDAAPGTAAIVLAYDPSARTDGLAAHAAASGDLEFVVFGRSVGSRMLELVVGRLVAVPVRPELRPDDPLPRVVRPSNAVCRAAGSTRRPSFSSDDEGVPTASARDARVRKRGLVQLTPERLHVRTPGRRGEKRPRVKREQLPLKPESPPCTGIPALWRPIAPIVLDAPALPLSPDLEAQNRAMIKRLVKYQLAGRGVDRDHRDHDACFQMAYAGTCLVFVRRLYYAYTARGNGRAHTRKNRHSQRRCCAPRHVHESLAPRTLCARYHIDTHAAIVAAADAAAANLLHSARFFAPCPRQWCLDCGGSRRTGTSTRLVPRCAGSGAKSSRYLLPSFVTARRSTTSGRFTMASARSMDAPCRPRTRSRRAI